MSTSIMWKAWYVLACFLYGMEHTHVPVKFACLHSTNKSAQNSLGNYVLYQLMCIFLTKLKLNKVAVLGRIQGWFGQTP